MQQTALYSWSSCILFLQLSDLARQSVQQAVQQEDSDNLCTIEPMIRCPFITAANSGKGRSNFSPHQRHSSADFSTYSMQQPLPSARQNRYNSHYGSPTPKYEMPRRIKVFYFIAKFRLVQKFIMVCCKKKNRDSFDQYINKMDKFALFN